MRSSLPFYNGPTIVARGRPPGSCPRFARLTKQYSESRRVEMVSDLIYLWVRHKANTNISVEYHYGFCSCFVPLAGDLATED